MITSADWRSTALSFLIIALAVGLLWSGVLLLARGLVQAITGYQIPWSISTWVFVALFLGTFLGLCVNWGGGTR